MHGRIRTWGPGALVLLPTVLLLGYFVYGLIAWTFNTSLTDRHTARRAARSTMSGSRTTRTCSVRTGSSTR